MSNIVKHLPWIAPTAAILAVGSGITDNIHITFGSPDQQVASEGVAPAEDPAAAIAALAEPKAEPVVEVVAVAEPAVAAVVEPVAEPEPVVEIANEEPEIPDVPLIDARDVSSQLAALLKENNVTEYTVGVTRNEGFSIDSLLAATGDALEEQAALNGTEGEAVDQDFFAIAQAQLARDRQCIDDLAMLASHARVYFPVGGLIGEQSGIDQARLLGLLAEQCDGVTIQVEGHSDASGNSVVNQGLSEGRAEAVVTSVASSGIDPNLFAVVGFGDTQPSFVTGPQPDFYYDRRVEFKVIETGVQQASYVVPQQDEATVGPNLQVAACVSQLETAVQGASIEYAPSGVTVEATDLALASQLANIAENCPEARLRLVGQHSGETGGLEDPSTGRLRAVVLQTLLISEGFSGEQLIIGARSDSQPLAGFSDSRLDFEVVLEEY